MVEMTTDACYCISFYDVYLVASLVENLIITVALIIWKYFVMNRCD